MHSWSERQGKQAARDFLFVSVHSKVSGSHAVNPQSATSGRIRRGPAPLNLALPPYEFVSDSKIRIG